MLLRIALAGTAFFVLLTFGGHTFSQTSTELELESANLAEILNSSPIVEGYSRSVTIDQCVIEIVDVVVNPCVEEGVVRQGGDRIQIRIDLSALTHVLISERSAHPALFFLTDNDHFRPNLVTKTLRTCDGSEYDQDTSSGITLSVDTQTEEALNEFDFDHLIHSCGRTF